MAITHFDPQLVIARLAGQVTALKRVAGAADLAAAAEDVKQLPAAYVIELAESATPNSLATTAISQQDTVRFAVILAAQNLRDARGERAGADMRSLRLAVATALLGWPPDADSDPCEYASGRLLQLDNLVLWWQDEYITRLLLRSI